MQQREPWTKSHANRMVRTMNGFTVQVENAEKSWPLRSPLWNGVSHEATDHLSELLCRTSPAWIWRIGRQNGRHGQAGLLLRSLRISHQERRGMPCRIYHGPRTNLLHLGTRIYSIKSYEDTKKNSFPVQQWREIPTA